MGLESSDLSAGFSCVEVGEGLPLVAFPGLSQKPVKSGLAFLGLARITGRRVYVVNRPRGLARGITMAELAEMHARFLGKRFGGPVDVVAASAGGAIALQVAVDHPGCVRRLVVAAAAGWLGEEGREKLRRFGEEIERGRSGAGILASVLAPKKWEWIMRPMLWAEHQLERRSSPADMLATIDAEVGFDVRSRLGQIQARVLLISGGRDRAFPLELVQETAAGIVGSRLIVYPRAGHVGTMLNRNFGRDVAGFLAAE